MGTSNPIDLMTGEANQAEIEKHIELIGACCPEGRADGASNVAIDEVEAERADTVNGEFERERAKVVDRPGDADPACEVSVKFRG